MKCQANGDVSIAVKSSPKVIMTGPKIATGSAEIQITELYELLNTRTGGRELTNEEAVIMGLFSEIGGMVKNWGRDMQRFKEKYECCSDEELKRRFRSTSGTEQAVIAHILKERGYGAN